MTAGQSAPDVVGLGEIAAMAKVGKTRAGVLMDRRINPEAPEARQTSSGRIWDRQAVIDYFVASGRDKTWED